MTALLSRKAASCFSSSRIRVMVSSNFSVCCRWQGHNQVERRGRGQVARANHAPHLGYNSHLYSAIPACGPHRRLAAPRSFLAAPRFPISQHAAPDSSYPAESTNTRTRHACASFSVVGDCGLSVAVTYVLLLQLCDGLAVPHAVRGQVRLLDEVLHVHERFDDTQLCGRRTETHLQTRKHSGGSTGGYHTGQRTKARTSRDAFITGSSSSTVRAMSTVMLSAPRHGPSQHRSHAPGTRQGGHSPKGRVQRVLLR